MWKEHNSQRGRFRIKDKEEDLDWRKNKEFVNIDVSSMETRNTLSLDK